MLATMMTEEVIATRKAFSIGATHNVTVVGSLRSVLFYMLSLVTCEIFWVEKPLVACWTSMGSLITAEMDLKMTTMLDQY